MTFTGFLNGVRQFYIYQYFFYEILFYLVSSFSPLFSWIVWWTVLMNRLMNRLMNHLDESFWWIVLMNCFDESFWWIVLMNSFYNSFSWIFWWTVFINWLMNRLGESFDESFWWIVFMNRFDESYIKRKISNSCEVVKVQYYNFKFNPGLNLNYERLLNHVEGLAVQSLMTGSTGFLKLSAN